MARVEISEVVLRKTTGSNQPSIVPGASVQVNVRGSGAATVYLSATGGTTVSNPLTADSAGRIEGWLEFGSYDLVVSGSGIATYTQRFEAVPPDAVAALAEANTFTTSQTLQDGSFYLDRSAGPNSVGPEIHFTGFNGGWGIGVDVANAPLSRDFVPVLQHAAYYFNDGVTTNGSPTVTSASEGGFADAIEGATISGTGIPNGTTVSNVVSATELTMSANATANGTGLRIHIDLDGVGDLMYVKHRGGKPATIGFAITPPDGNYRVQFGAADSEVAMGTVAIRIGASQTGHALAFRDSTNTAKLWVRSDFSIQGDNGFGGSLAIRGDSDTDRSLTLLNNAGSSVMGWDYNSSSWRFRDFTNNKTILQWFSQEFYIDQNLYHRGSKLGFYSATAITKPTGVAVTAAGIHAALVSLGLIAA